MKDLICKSCEAKIKYSDEIAAFFQDECDSKPICVKCFYIQAETPAFKEEGKA